MKFQLILLILSLCCWTQIFGQTTIIPETVSSDEELTQDVTISPENIVLDETIPNEAAVIPAEIIRNTEEETSKSTVSQQPQQQQQSIAFHLQQQQQATDSPQQHQSQHQWNLPRVHQMNRFQIPHNSMPTAVNQVYRMTGHRHHHPQIPHRSINLAYPYHSYVPQQQTQSVPQARSLSPTNGCQGTKKRDVDENESKINFESWYLNIANHDLLFSVCGTLLPGHRILIESSSPEFSAWIQKKLDSGKADKNEPIMIQSINELIHNDNDNDDIDGNNKQKNQCSNEELLAAFKIFLHYFYSGTAAFDSIDDVNVSLFVLQMAREFLGEKIAERIVEPKIIQSMKIDSLIRVYHFWHTNKLDSLKLKWSKFIADHSSLFSNHVPFSCDEVINDVELLDQFLQSLNTTQAQVIGFIRHFLQNCPESIHQTIKDASSLPNSLYFFRCTIDDLKELHQIGFISIEILAEELENRLRAKERVCEELKRTPFLNPKTFNLFRQMEPYLGAFRRAA